MQQKDRVDSTRKTVPGKPNMPEFMHPHRGRGLEGLKPEDVDWVGEEFLVGDDDKERDRKYDAIAREIFSPRYALRRILFHIVQSHPCKDSKWSDEARLEAALNALLGPDNQSLTKSSGKHSGGPKERSDDAFLRIIAREYLVDTYGFNVKHRSVSELCRVAVEERLANWRNTPQKQLDAIEHRLRRKFAAGERRDRVMIEYTGGAQYEHRRYIDLTNRIISYLPPLGLTHRKTPDRTRPRS